MPRKPRRLLVDEFRNFRTLDDAKRYAIPIPKESPQYETVIVKQGNRYNVKVFLRND